MKTTKVEGFPNYIISEDGNVFSLKSNKYLKPFKNKDTNYYMVILYNGSIRKIKYLHRLIAIHFIKNSNDLPEVDHMDSDKSNNCVENLRWISMKDNRRGKKECKISISEKQKARMRKYYQNNRERIKSHNINYYYEQKLKNKNNI